MTEKGKKNLEEQVLAYIEKEQLLHPGDRVVTAVSGGADSVCLLLLLKKLEKRLQIQVEAVTLDHGIRGEAARADVAFVKDLCERAGVFLHVFQVDVPKLAMQEKRSEEEAGRRARYACFVEAARKSGAQAIAVAHHLDDNCETILHHLFRGSALRGLRGMVPLRRLEEFTLIRPLLSVRRREIEAWLSGQNLTWRTDETNLENIYTRNRLRNQIIPQIEQEINARASVHVAQAGRYLEEAQALIEQLARDWMGEHVQEEPLGPSPEAKRALRVSVEALQACPPVVHREILMQLCMQTFREKESFPSRNDIPAHVDPESADFAEPGPVRDLTHTHLEMILQLEHSQTSRRLVLPGRILVRKEYGCLLFEAEPGSLKAKERASFLEEQGAKVTLWLESDDKKCRKKVEVQEEGLRKGLSFRIFTYNKEKIPENTYTKWFDYDKIKDGLSLRTRRKGDYFLLENGGRKTLKSYLIDQKIPAGERDRVVLLTEGSHVLWICDGRISSGYRVSGETKMILELYMEEESYHERKNTGSAYRRRSGSENQ